MGRSTESTGLSTFPGFNLPSLGTLLVATLICFACSSRPAPDRAPVYGFTPTAFPWDVGDDERFTFSYIGAVSDGHDRLLILYDRLDRARGQSEGRFFRISKDGGASFGPERSAKGVSGGEEGVAYTLRFTPIGLAAVYSLGTNVFYTRSSDDGATWPEPVQINDELDSTPINATVSLIQPSENEIYCLWPDKRRGFLLAYFSASSDGGRTWRANQPVEYDFREGNQTQPRLVSGAGGRLVAVWEDWRNRQTLVDIRSSYSDDGGRHWSESSIINDDRQHVWQIVFDVVAQGDHVYVAFQDFREPGLEGDNDWNIYFARSEDNATTWSANVRLNDVQEGVDKWPSLAIDEDGTLSCAWASSRENIFGDIVLSTSTDDGKSWSRSFRVSAGDGLSERSTANLVVSKRRLLCQWLEENTDSTRYRLAWMDPLTSPDPPSTARPDSVPARPSPLALEEGRTLFQDDFSSGGDVGWQATDGTWMTVNGAYMGIAAGQHFSSSYARCAEPERYILKGRFMLDPVSHKMAYLYFRADPATNTYYVIAHRFRVGVWLGIDDESGSKASRHYLNGRPLAQRAYPFQNNRWYDFRLVVTPDQVDYYVENRLMLSYEGRLALPPKAIGIGGFEKAPAYFDDIVLTDIRHDASQ